MKDGKINIHNKMTLKEGGEEKSSQQAVSLSYYLR